MIEKVKVTTPNMFKSILFKKLALFISYNYTSLGKLFSLREREYQTWKIFIIYIFVVFFNSQNDELVVISYAVSRVLPC